MGLTARYPDLKNYSIRCIDHQNLYDLQQNLKQERHEPTEFNIKWPYRDSILYIIDMVFIESNHVRVPDSTDTGLVSRMDEY